MTELIPTDEVAAMGYPHQVVSGIKACNGVAISSKKPFQKTGHMDCGGKNDAGHVLAVLPENIELQDVYVPADGEIRGTDLMINSITSLIF